MRRENRCWRAIIERGNSEEESRERTHVCALTGWRSRDGNDSGESGRPSGKYIGPQGGGGSEEEGGGGPSTHPSAPVCTHTRHHARVHARCKAHAPAGTRRRAASPRKRIEKEKESTGALLFRDTFSRVRISTRTLKRIFLIVSETLSVTYPKEISISVFQELGTTTTTILRSKYNRRIRFRRFLT